MKNTIKIRIAALASALALAYTGTPGAPGLDATELPATAPPASIASVETFPEVSIPDASRRVRVGLVSLSGTQVSAITVENTALRLGFNIGGVFVSCAIVYSDGGFEFRAAGSPYVRLNAEFAQYDAAALAAAAYARDGSPAMPGLSATGGWTVFTGGYTDEGEAALAAAVMGGAVSLPASSSRIALYAGDNCIAIFEGNGLYPQIMPLTEEPLSVAGNTYRGTVEFGRYSGGGLTAVNTLTLDQYLASVIASEMPASWDKEALKAQACAARTYALTQLETHLNGHETYDLCDNEHCQVYRGTASETVSSAEAAAATDGLAVYHGSALIEALYFSSSGGATDDSEHAWGNAVSYLRGVIDPNESEYKAWVNTVTLSEISAILEAKNAGIGAATGVAVTDQTETGWVTALTIYGASGSLTIEREAIRTFFAGSSAGSLPSRKFSTVEGVSVSDAYYAENGTRSARLNIDPAMSLTTSGGSSFSLMSDTLTLFAENELVSYGSQGNTGAAITFVGRGWGHGVGMSQYGAKGMAEAGFTFDQILQYFYTGVEIR